VTGLSHRRLPQGGICAVALTTLGAIALAGCGGAREVAQPTRNCLQAWNAPDNTRNQTRVAGLYSYAKVVPSARQTGCGFAFHGDDPPLLLLSARWRGHGDQLVFGKTPAARRLDGLPGGTPPSGRDNVVVTGKGYLLAGRFPPSTQIAKPRTAPEWLLLRARHDSWLFNDPAPRVVTVSLRRHLWRIKLEGDFLCEICFRPNARTRRKHKKFVIEEFDPRTKAAAGVSLQS
jgi:hypothetical protein